MQSIFSGEELSKHGRDFILAKFPKAVNFFKKNKNLKRILYYSFGTIDMIFFPWIIFVIIPYPIYGQTRSSEKEASLSSSDFWSFFSFKKQQPISIH